MKLNTYDLSGEYGIGYLDNGKEFYFDLEDYDKIKDYHWVNDEKGYIIAVIQVYPEGRRRSTKTVRLHRLVLGLINAPYYVYVDHKYHQKHDNRKDQLRISSNSQNQMNRGIPANNSSGVKGVCWHKRKNKWEAFIWANGKKTWLGTYDNFDDAVFIRKEAEKQYFGEFNYQEVAI